MASGRAQLSENFRQLRNGPWPPFAVLAPRIVLAIETIQSATAEKNRSGTFGSGYGRFFAEMRAITVNLDHAAGLTIAAFVLRPLDATTARTQTAMLKKIVPFGLQTFPAQLLRLLFADFRGSVIPPLP